MAQVEYIIGQTNSNTRRIWVRGRGRREGERGRERGREGGREGRERGTDCFLTLLSIINSYYKELSNGTVVSVQKGVCRTNCIDCLDRYSILTIY